MEITAEFEGADLGDERLNRRLVWLGSQLAEEPGASFPDVAGGDAALEATYRFLGNERVSPGAILAPHVRQTLLRAARQAGPVVVAHDTTEFNFGDSPRRDLGRVGRGKSFGFYGHFAFAVSLTDMRQPLGLVGLRVHQRAGNQGRRGHTELQTGADNEGRRWEELVEDVAQTAEGLDVLHVMDREADSYALMAAMVERGRRFVIRCLSRLSTESSAPGSRPPTRSEEPPTSPPPPRTPPHTHKKERGPGYPGPRFHTSVMCARRL